jgi:predicted component of type VI protein secretion system
MYELLSPDGASFQLAGEVIRLGRASDNTIVVNDAAVSRYHVNFYIKDGALIAEDAGSANGFLINGQPVGGPTQLQPGDRVYIGSREYRVALAGQGMGMAAQEQAQMRPRAQPQRPRSTQARARPVPSGSGNNPLRIVLILGILGLVAVSLNKEEPAPLRQPAGNEDFIGLDLNAEGFASKPHVSKTLNEIKADQKFLEALRDFNNKNYSRAILGFRHVLTINPSHSKAQSYMQEAETALDTTLKSLYQDAQRSYARLQYGRAKGQTKRMLTIIIEQIPQYSRQIATENLASSQDKARSQEEILLKTPCAQNKSHQEICKRAVELLRQSRRALGEEDTLI